MRGTMEPMVFRIFEATLQGGEVIKVSCSNVREISLRQQMEQGQVTITSLKQVYETSDRNEARRIAGEV